MLVCVHPVNGGIGVSTSLTFSSAFVLLEDLQRILLDGRLTKAPALYNCGKIPDGTHRRRLRRGCSGLRASVNSRSRNIFNGLLRVPLMK